MTYNQERQSDLFVEANQDSPGQVLHHIAVFVLTATIICMQVQVGFIEAVSSKEMMQHADDVVRSLASIDCLVIYLLKGMLLSASCVVILIKSHLTWYGLTAHTENSTFYWYQKIHGPRLLRI